MLISMIPIFIEIGRRILSKVGLYLGIALSIAIVLFKIFLMGKKSKEQEELAKTAETIERINKAAAQAPRGKEAVLERLRKNGL